MNTQDEMKDKLSEEEIDKVVVAQADDDVAWEKPVRHKARPTSLSIPGELADRAAFLARLHRKGSVEEWLTHVIQERIELEEAAFVGVKQELAARHGP
jgi:hypothetical protein